MEWHKLVRADDLVKLRRNWEEQQPLKGTSNERDYEPVAKLVNPIGTGTWLITEVDAYGLAFGLADVGSPELGYFDLQEIADIRLLNGHVHIEQDLHFKAEKPISQYAEDARRTGSINA